MSIIKSTFQVFQGLLNELKDYKYNKFRLIGNKVIGDLYKSKRIKYQTDKYIICDALWDNPHHWLRVAIFGPVLSDFLKANLIGIYEKGTHHKILETLKSFDLDKYIKISPKIKRKHINQAKQLSKNIVTSADIVNLDLPYNFPGQFLYDSILKTEMVGNVDSKNNKISNYIAKLISYLEEYEEIIQWEKISALVISHPVHFRFSTITNLALRKGIPVYILNYVNEYIAIRKLEKIEDWIAGSFENPNYQIIKNLPQFKKDYLEKVGKNYLNEVRSAKKGEVSTVGTFKQDNNDNFDKNKFLENLNLDIHKQTVVVMTGCWPDFPNLYPSDWYTDYVDWLKKTLDIIQEIDNCNWIIKPHPAEFKYGAKTRMINFMKDIDKPNIVTWPNELSSNYLNKIADIVITSHGSAGVEYPAQGKPALITKKTYFADWGFVNFCSDYNDYKKKLNNIHKIKKPNLNSQKLAFIYIATSICNASKINSKYLFEMGSKSNKLWPSIKNFVESNDRNILNEQNMMQSWLNSDIQSYNFFKSINYDLWEI
ncbi:MAG: hypothetical protein CMK49_01060 [Prochlorococcus sp. SP3034]|nr:hypothetical protein [Prochlorococcus sp. SP3034]|tara:strand:+ start:9766 stop:11385 length:1620 start_codon:yes stop_codon:yes gene_type:complete